MKNYEIEVDKNVVSYIERCHAEYEVFKDNIAFLIQNNMDNAAIIDSATFQMYQEKELCAKIAYDNARKELELRFVPKSLKNHRIEWELDFRSGIMHIRQLCDCEVAI